MSSQQIPPERETIYLQNAEAVVEAATDPVFAKLGELVVEQAQAIMDGQATLLGPQYQAEKILADSARGPELVRETEQFLSSHNSEHVDKVQKPTQRLVKPTYGVSGIGNISRLSPEELAKLAELDKKDS